MAIPLTAQDYISIRPKMNDFPPVSQPGSPFDRNSTLWRCLIWQGHEDFKRAAYYCKGQFLIVSPNDDPPFELQGLMKLAIKVLVNTTSRFKNVTEERLTMHTQAYASALLLDQYALLANFNSDLKLYEGFVDCKRSDWLLELVQRCLPEKDYSLKETRIEITNAGLIKLKEVIKYSINEMLCIRNGHSSIERNMPLLAFYTKYPNVALTNHGSWVDFETNDTLEAVVREYVDPKAFSIASDIIQISSTGLEALIKTLHQEKCAGRYAFQSAATSAKILSEYVKPHKLEFELLSKGINCKKFPQLEAFVRKHLALRHFKADGDRIEISNIGLQTLWRIIHAKHAQIAHANRVIGYLLGPNSFRFECVGFGKCELGYSKESEQTMEDGHNLLSIAAECGYEMTGFSITSSERDRRQWSIENSTKAALPIAERREQNCHIVTDMKGVKNFLWKLYEIDTSGLRDYIRPLGSDFSA